MIVGYVVENASFNTVTYRNVLIFVSLESWSFLEVSISNLMKLDSRQTNKTL